jgi:hypothetical protein
MKKLTLTAILFLLLLTACGTQAVPAESSAPADSLPAAAELALGTFKLEGTGRAMTAAQAAELLPLWQVYQSLTASDTAAQEEIDALVEQIQGTMTSGQVEAIEAMNLSQSDMTALMVDENILESAPPQSASSNSSSSAAQGGPDGGMPSADMSAGDPLMTGGMQPVSSSTTSSNSASGDGAPAMTGTGVPSALLSALIQLLESRVG